MSFQLSTTVRSRFSITSLRCSQSFQCFQFQHARQNFLQGEHNVFCTQKHNVRGEVRGTVAYANNLYTNKLLKTKDVINLFAIRKAWRLSLILKYDLFFLFVQFFCTWNLIEQKETNHPATTCLIPK